MEFLWLEPMRGKNQVENYHLVNPQSATNKIFEKLESGRFVESDFTASFN